MPTADFYKINEHKKSPEFSGLFLCGNIDNLFFVI